MAVGLRAAPLVDRLDAHLASGAGGHSGLTPRELEVLELVALGRSNTEIGKHLFITGKTASVHVSNILAKLGAAGRTEAAAIARRQRNSPVSVSRRLHRRSARRTSAPMVPVARAG